MSNGGSVGRTARWTASKKGAAMVGKMGDKGDNGENRDNDRRPQCPWTYQSRDAVAVAQLRKS